MDRKEVGWECCELASSDAGCVCVCVVMNLQVSENSGNFLTS